MTLEAMYNIFGLGYYIFTTLTAISILLSDKKSSSIVAWLLVIYIFPYFGVFLYLLFGVDWRKRRIVKSKEYELFKSNIKKIKDVSVTSFDGKGKISSDISKLSKLVFNTKNFSMTSNKNYKLYFYGKEAFHDLLEDMKKAEHHIHMEFFIWRNDILGKKIKDILIEKANEGVEVRLIFDGLGSFKLGRKYLKDLEKTNVEYKIFLKIFPRIFKINYRTHKKIVVIDGKVLHTGGMNVGQEYIDGGNKFDIWRDTNIRIEGNLVSSYQVTFLKDWYNSGGKKYLKKNYFYKYDLPQNSYPMQLVESGADSTWPSIKKVYMGMITQAKTNIYIQSPYLILDDTLIEILENAALSGIDVKIMMTGNPDKKIPYWVAETHFERLLKTGVKIYRYKKGFLHNKNVTVDGALYSLGTCNFDLRSFDLNYEVNVLGSSEEIVTEIDRQFDIDLKESIEVLLDKVSNRSFLFKLRDSIFKIFSPIL